MATIGTAVNIADLTKQLDPDGKIADIGELLAQNSPVVKSMPMVEGNLITGNRSSVRTGLPTIYWKIINKPTPSSKSKTAQADDACGTMEAWGKVDVKLAELAPDLPKFRFNESQAFIEAMSQEGEQTLFYGNSSLNPEEFTGLSPRYSSLSAANAENIIDAAGTSSDNSSIWLVGWSPRTVFGIYPKGSKAGLTHEDKGKVVETSSDGELEVYKDKFNWNLGLCVKDWQYAVRIANIDISNLKAKSSAADLIELMIRATKKVRNLQACNPVFYMNRTVEACLDIQRRDDIITGAGLRYDVVDGLPVASFRGIRVEITDALLENEARVV